MSVVEGLKIQIHVCGTYVLNSFGLVYSIDWVRQRLDIFSFRTLTSMLTLLLISLSSELSDGSSVCSIQALV